MPEAGCTFHVRARARGSEFVVLSSNLVHTCDSLANRSSVRRNPSLSVSAVANAARSVVPTTLSGKRGDATKAMLAKTGDGAAASASALRRGVTVASSEFAATTHAEPWGALVAYIDAFDKADTLNLGVFEVDADVSPDGCATFKRAILCPGSTVRMLTSGLVSDIVCIDFGHLGGRVRSVESFLHAHIEGAYGAHAGPAVERRGHDDDADEDDEENESGAGEDEAASRAGVGGQAERKRAATELEESTGDTMAKRRRCMGRPAATTSGFGSLAVVTARTFTQSRVLLAVGVVEKESAEEAKWVLETMEAHVRFTQHHGGIKVICDRGIALNSAIGQVYGELADVVHCIIHFKRNLCGFLATCDDLTSKADRIVIMQHFEVAANTPDTLVFEDAMAAIERLSKKSFKYITDGHPPREWAASVIGQRFNPFGNTTSNDAETVFAAASEEKRQSGPLETVRKVVADAAARIYQAKSFSRRPGNFLASAAMNKEFNSRAQWGASNLRLVVQLDNERVHVASHDCPRRTLEVDLAEATPRSSWCSCGRNAVDILPCVHVIWAVKIFKLRGGDEASIVLPESTAAFVSERLRNITMYVPPTSNLRAAPNIKAPLWITVEVPRSYILQSPTLVNIVERSAPVALTSKQAFLAITGAQARTGARHSSFGEIDVNEMAAKRIAGNEMRKKVKVTLGDVAEALGKINKQSSSATTTTSTATATTTTTTSTTPTTPASAAPNPPTGDAGDEGKTKKSRGRRPCQACGQLGHYKKTCPKREMSTPVELGENQENEE